MNRVQTLFMILFTAVVVLSCLEEKPGRNNPLDPGGDKYSIPSIPNLFDPGEYAVSGIQYNLCWSSAKNAKSYVVYEDTTSSFSHPLITNINDTTYKYSHDTELAQIYYYKIKAMNDGYESETYSNIVDIVVIPQNPIMPEILGPSVILFSNDTYTLFWNDLSEYGAYKYILEESLDSSFLNPEAFETSSLSYSLSHNVWSETKYYYRLKAYSPFGESVWSNTISVTIFHNDSIPKMSLIPSGTFSMGDTSKHTVFLNSFLISSTETTQFQYTLLTGFTYYAFDGSRLPADKVDWYDAVKFCNILSRIAGLSECYDEENWLCDFTKDGFRLPTEAEWEYACRAGTDSKYYTGDEESDLDLAGWYSGNSGYSSTLSVAQKVQNKYGLFDMHGNVAEWCNDWYDKDYYINSVYQNPTGPEAGTYKVIRGGSWYSSSRYCTSGSRDSLEPTYRSGIVGFRVVRNAN